MGNFNYISAFVKFHDKKLTGEIFSGTIIKPKLNSILRLSQVKPDRPKVKSLKQQLAINRRNLQLSLYFFFTFFKMKIKEIDNESISILKFLEQNISCLGVEKVNAVNELCDLLVMRCVLGKLIGNIEAAILWSAIHLNRPLDVGR